MEALNVALEEKRKLPEESTYRRFDAVKFGYTNSVKETADARDKDMQKAVRKNIKKSM